MNKEEIKKITEELAVNADKIRESLDKLEADIEMIQKGDQDGPYWNGDNAYQCMKTALTQLECNREILKNLEKSVDYLNSLVKD